MPATITGNPTGVVAPMVTPPTPNQVPVITVPIDGEAASAGSLSSFEQQVMNHIALLMQQAVWNATFPSTGSNLPQMRFKDAAGNGRYVIDHNGLPTGGRVSQVREEWGFATGALSAGAQVGTPWTATLGTASALSLIAPSASYNARFLQVTPSSTATTGETVLTSFPFLVANTAGMSLALEFEFGLSVAGVGSNVTWYAGLGSSATDPSTDNSLVCLAKRFSAANYAIYTGNGVSNGITTTTTPPTTGAFPTDRIRIEIQGSASPYAVYEVRVWVNETLLNTITTGIPGGTALRLLFGCLNEGGAPSGSPIGYVGPLSMAWNRFTSGPAL